ncbi:unnamed protein product, partial [Scytosiphon promiscuus]
HYALPVITPSFGNPPLFFPRARVSLSAVAQYLPASSLDALSGACKAQYRTCNSLVPGLKLDLFPHQKKVT